MKLTEKKIKEFFPSDNRFIHFCAKRYGYAFFNDDAVHDARYYSSMNVMNYIKKYGDEFKDESHLVASVMSCIKFGILSAVSPSRIKKRVETVYESDIIYVSGRDQDGEYSKYQANCVSNDQEYGGYEMLLNDLRATISDPLEHIVLEQVMLKGKTLNKAAEDTDTDSRQLDLAKYRVRTKFKRIIKKEDERIKSSREIGNSHQSKVRPIGKGLSDEDRYQRLREEQNTERSYSETMSFLYS